MACKRLEAVEPEAIHAIQSGGNHYSFVALWELAIKSALRKVTLAIDGNRTTAREFVLAAAKRLQLAPIPLEFDDFADVESLPYHHKDPFDRLLVVQATRRAIPIISSDAVFEQYGVRRVW